MCGRIILHMERIDNYLYFEPHEQEIAALPPKAKVDWAPALFDQVVKKSLKYSRLAAAQKKQASYGETTRKTTTSEQLTTIKQELGELASEEILNSALSNVKGINIGRLYQK